MSILLEKLKRYRSKLRIKFFPISFIYFSGLVVFGGQTFNWEVQIEAIKQLALNDYLFDAEEAGKILLNVVEKEQVFLLELLGNICIVDNRYRQAADYYLRAGKKVNDRIEANRYWVIAGDAYYLNKDYSLAAAIYSERYHREADDEILFRYGNALLHSDTFDESKKIKFQSKRIQEKFDWNCAVYRYQKNDFTKACRILWPWLKGSYLGLSVYYFYAQMQYRLGYIDEAKRVVDLGRHLHHGWIDDKNYEKLLTLQLRIAIDQGNESVAENLESLLQKIENIDLGSILLIKANGLRSKGQIYEALDVLKKLGQYLPNEAKYLMGEIYLHDIYGGMEDALKLFEALGKSNGRMRGMGKLYQGNIESYLGNFQRAEVIYEELQKELDEVGWVKQKEEVREYLALKIARIKLAQEQSKFSANL